MCSQLSSPQPDLCVPFTHLRFLNARRGLLCAAMLNVLVPSLSSEDGQVHLLLVWLGTSPMAVGAPFVLGAELAYLSIQVYHHLS